MAPIVRSKTTCTPLSIRFLQESLCNLTNKWVFFLLLFISILLLVIKTQPLTLSYQLSRLSVSKSHENILDGCQYVYIDLGTNIGIQIRKLYEPHLYPGAGVLPLFQTVFGNHTSDVCSVGFEANPLHSGYLKEFENYCLQRKWRVKIFSPVAVSTRDGNITFYTEPGNEGNNQWGASLEVRAGENGKVTVPSIDMVSWFKSTVLTRKLPSKSNTSKVMMKHDIEGHDPKVLTDFIFRGVYCSIDLLYGEHLTNEFRKSVAELQQYSTSCGTKLVDSDDESYYTSRFPFVIPQA